MYTITISYVMGQSQVFLFGSDKDAAQSAFDTISSAMNEWRRFKNDSSETVTVEWSKGKTVFRLEHLASVDITDMKNHEAEQTEWSAFLGKLDGARKEAASPPPQERNTP